MPQLILRKRSEGEDLSCSLELADSKRQGARALALIAEFENDIRRERQRDGINKAKAAGTRF
jgi:DNA invertase Pin-like site-specific DNA recombinase